MPEIKNAFRQGVMNKDLDERLIPNGQYRDAMNVEVSTSENSDVGTVQNILGNKIIGIDKLQIFYDDDLVCVGAIADEKNDVFYYFLTGAIKNFIIELDHFGNETLVFVDTKRILGFNPDKIITGINIIDDLLFYTTNENEPKKINIKSCKQGTTSLATHTQLVVNGVNQGDIQLENITVIKKRPTKSPDVIFKESAIQNLVILPAINFFGQNIGDTISGVLIGDVNNPIWPSPFQLDDIILASSDTTSLTAGVFEVSLRVISIIPQLPALIGNPPVLTSFGVEIDFEIVAINSGTFQTDVAQSFNAIKKVDVEPIFEREFIRFATRYKYVDGEYSAFSPFTQPVFLAGRFGFHPTKDPYNLGMENNSINILLNNLVEANVPKDVVQLDILFKKERSTTIYTVDSIKPDDPGTPNKWDTSDFPNDAILSWSGTSLQSSTIEGNSPTGQYEITVENIYAALPENQLLRPYDNVPKKALAQEITGNRLVFANYVQNYDMIDLQGNYAKQNIQVAKEQRGFYFNENINFPENKGKKSIKSLRTYYLGVVYGDEFGRETPVFTSKNASINIPYDDEESSTYDLFNPDKSLRLKAKLNGPPPNWAYYFKYYIKQTTGEYYNLTMDRVYKTSGDENLWISFPSSDRNKIQEGDYFSIKKQVDIEQIVPVENKIKIIDIKNESPESIKYNYQNLGTASGSLTVLEDLFPNINKRPGDGVTSIEVDADEFVNTHGGIDIEKALTPSDRIALQFSINAPNGNGIIKSKIYLVTAFAVENTTVGSSATGQYNIALKDKIAESDSWVRDGNGNLNATDGLTFSILKTVEKDATEFEGRFFVKIISSPITQQFLIPSTTDINNFSNIGVVPYFNLSNTIQDPGNGATLIGINPNTCVNSVLTTTISNLSVQPSDFASASTFDSGANNDTGWFVDALGFVAAQEDSAPLDADKSGRMTKGDPSASKNQWVNGLEGVISFPNGTAGTPYSLTSARQWSNQAYRLANNRKIYQTIQDFGYVGNTSGGFTNTYNSANSSTPSYLHLSFMSPGIDLHDGNFNAIENEFQNNLPAQGFEWSDLYNTLFSKEFLQKIHAESIYQPKIKPGPDTPILGSNPKPERFKATTNLIGLNIGGARFQPEWANIGTSNYLTSGSSSWTPNPTSMGLSNTDPNDPDWANCFDPIHTQPSNQGIIDNLVQGRRFTIEGDDNTVYTILKVTKHFLYNHTSWNPHFRWSSGPAGGYSKYPFISPISGTVFTHDGEIDYGSAFSTPPIFAHFSVAQAMYEFAFLFNYSGGLGASGNGVGEPQWDDLKKTIVNFGKANNRRVTYILELDKDPRTASPSTSIYTSDNGAGTVSDTIPSLLNFVDNYLETGSNTLPTSPAIFETEAKEDVDLNIYFEASDNIPIGVIEAPNEIRGNILAPPGTKVVSELDGADPTDWEVVNDNAGTENLFLKVRGWQNGNTLLLTPPGLVHGTIGLQTIDYVGSKLRFIREDGSYIEATIIDIEVVNNKIFTLKINPDVFNEYYGLPYYNCFSFGNGVESNRIRDDFNETFILNGVKASTVLEEPYAEEHRKYGLIFSGLYNSISGVNNLNQFIQAEKITKDVNPTFGSIQKLYSRTKDLVTLCEDKVLQIFVDRDLLFNAEGQTQLLTSNRFLGTTQPFAGNFGISTNPESFAAESFRAYFTDKQRGAVLRLSRDGLTPISDAGMTDYFRDKLPNYDVLYGSYDAYKGDYNLTLKQQSESNNSTRSALTRSISLDDTTVTYNEKAKGWVSFKSFIPEIAISSVKQYYSFNQGQSYKHHVSNIRNDFYGEFTPSTITPILNMQPELVKHFNTLNYEGTQAKVDIFTTDASTGLTDGQYYNLQTKKGWFVESVFTNKQEGTVNEFIEKEGKWFNYIKGTELHIDPAAFNFQGIGIVDNTISPTPANVFGCMDPTAANYDPNATIDDGSCVPIVYGCTDPNALNYNAGANLDDGSCIYPIYGCTDPSATNYDPNANTDDGSCTYLTPVCGIVGASNYDSNANPNTTVVDNTTCNFILIMQVRPINPNTNSSSHARVQYVNSNGIIDGLPQIVDGWVYSWTYMIQDNFTQGAPLVAYTNPNNVMLVAGAEPGPISVTLTFTPTGQTYTLNGTVTETVVLGCTSPNSSNFNWNANEDDGSCVII